MNDPLADAPDLPRGTATAGEAPPAAPAAADAPAPAAAAPLLDDKGQPHDPRWHVVPPRKNIKGCWAGKPGNAGRLKAGKPPSGGTFTSAPAPAAAPAAPAAPDASAPAAPASPPPASASQLAWDDAPTPGAAGEEVDAKPVEARPREAYTATARSVVVAQFGIAQMAMGKAWDPEPAERKAWEQAWMDLMHHYQLPVVGPVLGLVILAIDSIAKRRNDPETKERAKALWAALLGSFRRRAVAPAPGHGEPARPAPAPVEGDYSAAYRR